MFFGEFSYQIDAKNRFRIPAKLKAINSSGAFLTKGTNGCLFIFGKKRFDELAEKFQDVSIFEQNSMLELRMFYSGACEIEEDSQGRILLPQSLIKFAEIQKDIVFLGANDHIELWAKEKFELYSKNFNSLSSVKIKSGK